MTLIGSNDDLLIRLRIAKLFFISKECTVSRVPNRVSIELLIAVISGSLAL